MSDVPRKILRLASAIHNACENIYKQRKCSECPFNTFGGCKLTGQPITWENKLLEAKRELAK